MYNFDNLSVKSRFANGDINGFWPSQGKCDLRDHLCMIGVQSDIKSHIDDLLKNTQFQIGNCVLKSNSIQDIAPYMFSLVNSAGDTYVLSESPYIDSEEFESFSLRADRLRQFFKKCKRNKETPSFTAFSTWNKDWEFSPSTVYDKAYNVMFNRLIANPKADNKELCRDLHSSWKNSVREDLVDFLIGLGCNNSHPMVRKFISDIYNFYKLQNDLLDAPYKDSQDFNKEFHNAISIRGWINSEDK